MGIVQRKRAYKEVLDLIFDLKEKAFFIEKDLSDSAESTDNLFRSRRREISDRSMSWGEIIDKINDLENDLLATEL